MLCLANPKSITISAWTEHRIAVDAVEKVDGKLHVTMRQPAWTRFNATVSGPFVGGVQPGPGAPVWAEGVSELMESGQWFLDEAGCRVHYRGDPAGAEWRLAVSPSLMQATEVTDISLESLGFAYSTWLGPASRDGLVDNQGGVHFVSTATACHHVCRLRPLLPTGLLPGRRVQAAAGRGQFDRKRRLSAGARRALLRRLRAHLHPGLRFPPHRPDRCRVHGR